MFFFIVGVQPRTRPVDGGVVRTLWCPSCGTSRVFREARSRQYLTVFFVPLVPLGAGRRVMACESCGAAVATEAGGGVPTATPAELSRADAGGREGRGRSRSSRSPAQIHCVRCGAKVLVPDGRGQHEVTCPTCGSSFEVRL